MGGFVITGVGLLVGAGLGWVSIYGLVTSQTSSDGTSPVNADTNSIQYGVTTDTTSGSASE